MLQVIDELEKLMEPLIEVSVVQEAGFGQLERPNFSWEVAREAILNALTHRDYFQHLGVQLDVFSDRLEIASPGGFIGGVSATNILRHPPVHRNEVLARAFQAMGLVNRAGMGVDRIYEGLLRIGKGLPRYESDEQHVKLILPLQTHEGFALFVHEEEREGKALDLEDLLILQALLTQSSLDRWRGAEVLHLSHEEAADRLGDLRRRGPGERQGHSLLPHKESG